MHSEGCQRSTTLTDWLPDLGTTTSGPLAVSLRFFQSVGVHNALGAFLAMVRYIN